MQGAAAYPQKWWRQWQAEQAKIDFAASPLLAACAGGADAFPLASEAFFQCGVTLARAHPALYTLLCEFYAVDPAGAKAGGADSAFQ